VSGSDRPLAVCLLPVRNGTGHLDGWLASAEHFADAVVALDDGSTDDTREVLEHHPLVVRVLTNPVRQTYHGWDDSANRNRLLDTAGELRPRWVISLDADERIDEEDARALRLFLERDAVPGLAYGFRVFRMIGSPSTYDRSALWVYRLFAHEPGQTFPSERLHFVPVPVSIPKHRWVNTTVRIQHLSSLTEADRQERYQKYVEADGDRSFQADYEHLLRAPGELHTWRRRALGAPVLADHGHGESEDLDIDRPVLSAIVISRDDEDRIERSVRSVVDQEMPVPFEVIVVTSGTDRTAEIVRTRFPQVRLVELTEPALPGRARNAGLAVARGEFISFPGSHVELTPGSLAARTRAHEAGWAMVTGTTVNGNETFAGWASYFLDHSSVLPGRPATELSQPPAHCSYRASLLSELGGFSEDRRTGEDTLVNRELFRRGHTGFRDPAVTIVHCSPSRTSRHLLVHHFRRGRGLGRLVREDGRRPGPLRDRRFLWRMGAAYVPDRVRQTTRNVRRWGGDLEPIYRRVLVGVAAGAIAAWAGMWYELLRPRRGWWAPLFAAPIGRRGVGQEAAAPRAGATRAIKVLTTGYCPCRRCAAGSGDGPVGRGIAADHVLLPRGAVLDIPGYGRAAVDDVLPAGESLVADGAHVALRFETHDEATAWGRQWHLLDLPADTPAVVGPVVV